MYVSIDDPAANDVTGCGDGPVGTGASNRPCLTIAQAFVEVAGSGGLKTRIVVADGLYEETVSMVDSVSLLGGYRADTWERHLSTTLTTLRGSGALENHLYAVLSDVPITTATSLEGFHIEGPDNINPGGNSYAVYVSGASSDLNIAGNLIAAGDAGGGAGASAGASGPAGAGGSGGPGASYDGFDAAGAGICNPFNNRKYSNAGARSCNGDDVGGGNGGGNQCPVSDTGAELSGIDGSNGSAGVGGDGGGGGSGGDCLGGGDCFCNGSAGDGGVGGAGGQGGGGGGGCGGNSYGIYSSGIGNPNYCSDEVANIFSAGVAGSGGSGGLSIGNAGADGASGGVSDCSFN